MSFRSVKGSKKADKRFFGCESVEKFPVWLSSLFQKLIYLIVHKEKDRNRCSMSVFISIKTKLNFTSNF